MKMKKEKNKEDKTGIEYYYEKNRFFNLLFKTNKITDLFFSKEASISFILTLIIGITYLQILHGGFLFDGIGYFSQNIIIVLEIANEMLPVIVGGLFALLGFTIGGLAIVTGTIEKNVIDVMREKDKVDHFISVIFNFYFSGFILGVTIIFCIFTLIIIKIPSEFSYVFFILSSFLLIYMVIFAIIYSVMLLGTCIRIFLLKYYYQDK